MPSTNFPRCLTIDDVWAGPAREGAEADLGVRFRVEGTEGLAVGEIGWPAWPERCPSTLDYTTTAGGWHRPRWPEAWFPDGFVGPMAELLRDLEGTAPPSPPATIICSRSRSTMPPTVWPGSTGAWR